MLCVPRMLVIGMLHHRAVGHHVLCAVVCLPLVVVGVVFGAR
jgi:hypothetical protein